MRKPADSKLRIRIVISDLHILGNAHMQLKRMNRPKEDALVSSTPLEKKASNLLSDYQKQFESYAGQE